VPAHVRQPFAVNGVSAATQGRTVTREVLLANRPRRFPALLRTCGVGSSVALGLSRAGVAEAGVGVRGGRSGRMRRLLLLVRRPAGATRHAEHPYIRDAAEKESNADNAKAIAPELVTRRRPGPSLRGTVIVALPYFGEQRARC
jgi:hypothetical protein